MNFFVSNRLPFKNEVYFSVRSAGATFGSQIQIDAITEIAKAIRNLWLEVFHESQLLSLSRVKTMISKICENYKSAFKKKEKSPRLVSQKLSKELNELFDILKDRQDLDSLQSDEKNFYLDQKSSRIYIIQDFIKEDEEKAVNSSHQEKQEETEDDIEMQSLEDVHFNSILCSNYSACRYI